MRCRHALRHSTASLLLAAGVTPELAAKIKAHKDIRTSCTTHSAVTYCPPTAQDAARQVEGFVARVAPFSDVGSASETRVDGKPDGKGHTTANFRQPELRRPLSL